MWQKHVHCVINDKVHKGKFNSHVYVEATIYETFGYIVFLSID